MRHLPIKLGAAFLAVCLLASFGQAGAMPALSPNDSTNIASPVEKAGYWRHGYGYHPYRYWGGYGYYRPYRHYGYGYRYHRYGNNWRY